MAECPLRGHPNGEASIKKMHLRLTRRKHRSVANEWQRSLIELRQIHGFRILSTVLDQVIRRPQWAVKVLL